MSTYSQAVYALPSAPRSTTRVSLPSAFLLPSFGTVVFVVTVVQVLLLSQGAQTLFRDSDTGWHLRNGQAILQTLSLPRVDHFSYTREGAPWFAWEWLSDVVLGGIFEIAGLSGVAILSALAIGLTAWAVARLTLSLGGNLFFTAAAMVLWLATTSIHWLARPHIFSWILSVLFLAVAEHERRKASRMMYWLPLFACLWANLHGSFLLGPAILFIYAVGERLADWRRGSGVRFAGIGLAALVATFLNPYGWHLHEHVFGYLQNEYLMDHISEFRSFSFHAAGALYIELFLFVAVAGTLALLKQRAFGPALLALAILHLSLYSARHLPTAAVLLLPLSVAALTREAQSWQPLRSFLDYSGRLRAIDRKVWGIVPLLLVLAVTLTAFNAIARSGGVGFDPATFPVRAAEFLERRNYTGRGFTKDQWGGYLIYRFAGRTRVFMDGRSDFYGQTLLETYAQVADVKPGWDAVLKQYDVQFILIPPEHALASVLQLSSRWRRVYTDSVAVVFERVS